MATAQPHLRTYQPTEVVSFRKTREAFGGLSNMASGYPIEIDGVRIRTSEALYQACRFPHMPTVQKLIIEQVSPMTAKMRSKPYRRDSRPDWDFVRIPIMKWCLRVKLAQNWPTFGSLLLQTGDQPIVEDSTKDDFWGAMRDEVGVLRGRNVLGRLLMELRERLRTDPQSLETIEPLPIPDFFLLSRPIPAVVMPELPIAGHSLIELRLRSHQFNNELGLLPDAPPKLAMPQVEQTGSIGDGAIQPAISPSNMPQPKGAGDHDTEELIHPIKRGRRRAIILTAAVGVLILCLILWLSVR